MEIKMHYSIFGLAMQAETVSRFIPAAFVAQRICRIKGLGGL